MSDFNFIYLPEYSTVKRVLVIKNKVLYKCKQVTKIISVHNIYKFVKWEYKL